MHNVATKLVCISSKGNSGIIFCFWKNIYIFKSFLTDTHIHTRVRTDIQTHYKIIYALMVVCIYELRVVVQSKFYWVKLFKGVIVKKRRKKICKLNIFVRHLPIIVFEKQYIIRYTITTCSVEIYTLINIHIHYNICMTYEYICSYNT